MFIYSNYKKIKKRIIIACKKCKRDPTEIKLIAVSKNQPIKRIKEMVSFGQMEFGENYIKEGINKMQQIENEKLVWHFIGTIQSNKSRLIAEHYSWCHSIDGISIANRLNQQRPFFLPPLNILIQINFDKELNKSGILLERLPRLIKEIQNFPKLKLRGFMVIPKKENDHIKQLQKYKLLFQIFNQYFKKYSNINTLSLGMTDDLESAISAGSNMIRVGKGIFSNSNYY